MDSNTQRKLEKISAISKMISFADRAIEAMEIQREGMMMMAVKLASELDSDDLPFQVLLPVMAAFGCEKATPLCLETHNLDEMVVMKQWNDLVDRMK